MPSAKPSTPPTRKRAVPSKANSAKFLADPAAPPVASLDISTSAIALSQSSESQDTSLSVVLSDIIGDVAKTSKPAPVEALVSLTKTASTLSASSNKTVKLMSEMTSSIPFKKGYEDIAAFSKANLDAVILSNQIFAKGFEELSKEVMSISQSSVESATSAAKAIFSAKSIKDMVELNADYTKAVFDKFLSNSTKLSEMGVKVATDALGPVTARVQTAVEKVIKPSPVA